MIDSWLFNVENIIIFPSSIIHFMGPLNTEDVHQDGHPMLKEFCGVQRYLANGA